MRPGSSLAKLPTSSADNVPASCCPEARFCPALDKGLFHGTTGTWISWKESPECFPLKSIRRPVAPDFLVYGGWVQIVRQLTPGFLNFRSAQVQLQVESKRLLCPLRSGLRFSSKCRLLSRSDSENFWVTLRCRFGNFQQMLQNFSGNLFPISFALADRWTKFSTVEVPKSQPCFEHFFRPCFRGHDEAGLLAFEALRGSPRPARGQASDAKRNGTRTKRGSRGLESV